MYGLCLACRLLVVVVPFLFLAAVVAIIYGVASLIFRPRRGEGGLIQYYDEPGRFFQEPASFVEKGAKGCASVVSEWVENGRATVSVTSKHLIVRPDVDLSPLFEPLLKSTIPMNQIKRVEEKNGGYYNVLIEFKRANLSDSKLWLRLRWSRDFVEAINDATSNDSHSVG